MSRPARQLPNYQITQLPDAPASRRRRDALVEYYKVLLSRFGPQNWWPAQSRFEVIVGAYLTQNTNWGNVRRAIQNLKDGVGLDARKLFALPEARLAELIRPAGYFNVKARRLRSFLPQRSPPACR